MKKVWLVICLLFIAYICFAAKLAELPFTIDANQRMVAFGEVNGVNGYYIIDTGAPCIITFFDLKNLPVTNTSNIWMGGESFDAVVHKIDTITMGGMVINGDLAVFELPESLRSGFSSEIKGIVNINIFDDFIIEYSFSQRKIYLHDTLPEGYSAKVKIRREGVFQYIPITINNKSFDFLIDTGEPKYIQFPELAIDLKKENSAVKEIVVSERSKETNKSNYFVFLLNSFKLFQHTYSNVICNSNNGYKKNETGNVGLGVLSLYDLAFDMKSDNLYFKTSFSDSFFDMNFVHEEKVKSNGLIKIDYTGGDYFEVVQIVKDSPAWIVGLRPAMKISKINSISCKGISFDYVKRVLQSSDDVTIEYITDKGKNKTVLLKSEFF